MLALDLSGNMVYLEELWHTYFAWNALPVIISSNLQPCLLCAGAAATDRTVECLSSAAEAVSTGP